MSTTGTLSSAELREYDRLYREGGLRTMASPHVHYQDGVCPHADCGQRLEWIDFQLELHGDKEGVYKPLVRAWWEGTGFAGRCPACQGWIRFTTLGIEAIDGTAPPHCRIYLRIGTPLPNLVNRSHLHREEADVNAPLTLAKAELFYPSSDGEPMGETSLHVDALSDWDQVMLTLFANEMMVQVLANVFLYYEDGNPNVRQCPDVMIIKGVEKRPRPFFKTWEEKAVPSVIFELVSEETWELDCGVKKQVYQRLQVPEYFLFDPEMKHLKKPLMGFRLCNEVYESLHEDAHGRLLSKDLGIWIERDGALLRGTKVASGERLLHHFEYAAALQELARERAAYTVQRAAASEWKAQEEKARADLAEAEVARLRALIDRLQKPSDTP